MNIKIPEEKISSFVGIFLAFLLFISSFFLIYGNEVILDKNSQKTRIEKKIYYSKLYFGGTLEKISDYKNNIFIESKDSEFMSKWIIRFIGIILMGFSSSLFMIQIFQGKEKESLVKKSFLYSFFGVIFFIILLKIYLFYLSGGFNIDFSWISKKGQNGLSLIDKTIIIIIIIFIFVFIGILYNKIQQKEK